MQYPTGNTANSNGQGILLHDSHNNQIYHNNFIDNTKQADVDLAAEGWPDLAAASIPSITTPLIEKTPLIGGSVGLGLLAVNWIIQRRIKLAAHNSETDNSVAERESGDED